MGFEKKFKDFFFFIYSYEKIQLLLIALFSPWIMVWTNFNPYYLGMLYRSFSFSDQMVFEIFLNANKFSIILNHLSFKQGVVFKITERGFPSPRNAVCQDRLQFDQCQKRRNKQYEKTTYRQMNAGLKVISKFHMSFQLKDLKRGTVCVCINRHVAEQTSSAVYIVVGIESQRLQYISMY